MITETYIPLRVFEGLKARRHRLQNHHEHDTAFGVNAARPLLQERYDDHLAKLQELAELEYEHNVHNGHIRYLAEHYATEFKRARDLGTL